MGALHSPRNTKLVSRCYIVLKAKLKQCVFSLLLKAASTYVDGAHCYRCSVVRRSVGLSRSWTDREPCKNGRTDRDAVWVVDSRGYDVLDGGDVPPGKGQFWEEGASHCKVYCIPSMCGGDAAFCQITLTTSYTLLLYCSSLFLSLSMYSLLLLPAGLWHFGWPFLKWWFALCYRTVVCLSVCLWRCCIVAKRLNGLKWNLAWT